LSTGSDSHLHSDSFVGLVPNQLKIICCKQVNIAMSRLDL
jgi:hypothetical protein